MKITKVMGREIYDARGWPTIQCEIELDDSYWVTASVPSDVAQSSTESCILLDGGSRLWGRGVLKAIEYIEYIVAPALVGKKPDGAVLDALLLELDGTEHKSYLGANTLLAVSIAVHRAQAYDERLELFELIAQRLAADHVTIPFPQFHMFSGGMSQNRVFPIQELLLVPMGMNTFRAAMETSVMLFHELKSLLQRYGYAVPVSDEGSYTAALPLEEALLSICELLVNRGATQECQFAIALRVGAQDWYDPVQNIYTYENQSFTTEQLLDWYSTLVQTFPIYSLEDLFAVQDTRGWSSCMQQLGDKIQIVANTLCNSQKQAIEHAVAQGYMNAVTLTPTQVGSVSELCAIIAFCQEHNINTVLSHSPGETDDTFIADFAVGVSAGQIKAGGCSRGERVAKYNRLLAIEDLLLWDLLIK